MRKIFLSLLILTATALLPIANAGAALSVSEGNLIQVVDGNGGGVQITGNIFPAGLYSVGYYLNGGSWQAFNTNTPLFGHGDVLELALKSTSNEYYGLDRITDMVFNEVPSPGYNYYGSVQVFWDVPPVFGYSPISNAVSIAGSGQPDGIAPVPEPATLFLMGSGLAGFLAMDRKKKALKA